MSDPFDTGSCYTDDDDNILDYDSVAKKDEEKKTQVRQVQQLAQHETSRIRFWRVIVLTLLIVTGIIVSSLTYLLLIKQEDDDYIAKYESYVNTIGDSMDFHISSMAQASRNMAEIVTATALTTNATFPFVTVPMFEVHGEHARKQSGAELVLYVPIVTEADRPQYEQYSNAHLNWVAESRATYIKAEKLPDSSDYDTITNFTFGIYERDESMAVISAITPAPYAPVWQVSPPPFTSLFINYNGMVESFIKTLYNAVMSTKDSVFSPHIEMERLSGTAVNGERHKLMHDKFVNMDKSFGETAYDHPHSILAQPVFSELNDATSAVVGMVIFVVPWDRYFSRLLPDNASAIHAVLHNTCGQAFTYTVWGNTAIFEGEGDLHNTEYDVFQSEIDMKSYTGVTEKSSTAVDHCVYSVKLYPTDDLSGSVRTKLPIVFVMLIAFTFFMTTLTFFVYDQFVRRRNQVVVDNAARSNAIVASLFPTTFRDRLFEKERRQTRDTSKNKQSLSRYLDGDSMYGMQSEDFNKKPIADLFPNTTIMFADIAGFTAWSSAREPAQVFILLETLYRAFDEIAKRRGVYKVETIGDSYVAVCGLPEPCEEHFVVMARFARDCLSRMHVLTRKLEVSLGPDTCDLSMRIGLHSGPVTAGVLRGERSRFQLFGDTMNTASRMESTGVKNRIQISQDTADLLIAVGKSSWIKPREEKVVAKGKGELNTYWLDLSKKKSDTNSVLSSNKNTSATRDDTSVNSVGDSDSDSDMEDWEKAGRVTVSAKISRLIDWNVDVLLRSLKAVVSRRQATPRKSILKASSSLSTTSLKFGDDDTKVIDEMSNFVPIADYDPMADRIMVEPDIIELDAAVEAQLYDYVSTIASMYQDRPFHNFEHASHVTMSTVKLLSRIVARRPGEDMFANDDRSFHDNTYGISSDPLAQFACIFGALIHDVDHPGVPNDRLLTEGSKIANYYQNRSVSEQNSIDLAWKLFEEDNYRELRNALCPLESDLKRFRQFIVNIVLATDIWDEDLKLWREDRWEKAFSTAPVKDADKEHAMSCKATIVLEYLIQASNVAHTMQHWNIYRKWNELLFHESFLAYKDDRASENPIDTWFSNEIEFLEGYIVPLAKKLNDCGVFGVSSFEYLNYAEKNCTEWKIRGKVYVAEMAKKFSKTSSTDKLTTENDVNARGIDDAIVLASSPSKRRISVSSSIESLSRH